MSKDEIYIERCLQIAKNGLGTTQPNPMVGSVIVYNDKIIGEGYTSPYGGSHAEVNAIDRVMDKSLLDKSTLYVTLEPCSHYGKTPPCSDLIIKYKIPKVVIGCVDDNPAVSGKGIKKLRASGCNVVVGVLQEKCKQHHRRFFTFHNKKRPYIILKWAQTADGFIAPQDKKEKKPVWITNQYSRQLVHKWRAEEQAILVGTNTVNEDNPSLTVRDWVGNNPIRVVLDKDLKLDTSLSIFDSKANTIVISNDTIKRETTEGNDWSIHPPYNATVYVNENTVKASITWKNDMQIAKQICEVLYKSQINSLIIEGGAKTLQTFIDENLWDEARVFVGNVLFGKGLKAPEIKGKIASELNLLDDTLKIYKND